MPHNRSALWSLPLLCLGLCGVAACVLLPAVEANRRLAADRDQLRQDLARADAQVAVNDAFLTRSAAEPELAERLAQRQARQVRAGAEVLSLPGAAAAGTATANVADMLRVADPPVVAAYQPPAGWVGSLCGDRRVQLYGLGVAAFAIAIALLAGGGGEPSPSLSSPAPAAVTTPAVPA